MPAANPATAIVESNREGAYWMLGSVAAATAMTIAIRLLTPDIHSAMLAFMRSGFGVFLVLPFFWKARREGRPVQFTAWKLHIARGVLIAFALNCGFYAIWKLPMATATLLFFTAPVFATIFAIPLLGERVGPRRWTATALGFLGAVVVLRPGLGHTDHAMLMALASSLAFALTLLTGKLAARVDGNDSVFVSSSVIVVLGTLPPALFVWEVPTEPMLWAFIALLVAGSTARQYADIRAYSAGEAGFLAPFSYLRLVTVGVAGYVFFGETIDRWTLAGGAIIILSTLYIAFRGAGRAPAGPGGA